MQGTTCCEYRTQLYGLGLNREHEIFDHITDVPVGVNDTLETVAFEHELSIARADDAEHHEVQPTVPVATDGNGLRTVDTNPLDLMDEHCVTRREHANVLRAHRSHVDLTH